ncbi:hypothetical protein T265_02979 [Opisthorchis viverrini]|uniref:Rubicon Homology domain-containing protein n=1 Tax=Opisthorchis viverrini TaxID=6198 RepID=A0A074ZT89_OPIVI|nr:hypothetical protein T265_02979 [Opisthorchis viverrini]KER30628.1 hypothetical protein T265_02979 [Opisthorchis viverrini]
MTSVGSSIEVLSRTCLPATEYATSPPGSIPVGVEVTKHIVGTSILDQESVINMQAALYRYASHGRLHKRLGDPHYKSSCRSRSTGVRSNSSPSNKPTSTIRSNDFLTVLKVGLPDQSQSAGLTSPISQTHLSFLQNPLKPTLCHHLRQPDRYPRSTSVWRRLAKKPSPRHRSLPTLVVEPTADVLLGDRLSGDGQTDEERSTPGSSEVCLGHPSPIKKIPTGSNKCGPIPSPTVWWLDDDTGRGTGSGTVNRKAIFTLDPENICAAEPNEDATEHLLLPGRSGFEDELVREVAHFELTEFLIGELEFLNSMSLIRSIFPDEPAIDGDKAATPLGTDYSVSLSSSALDYQSNLPSVQPSESSLGWLTYIEPTPIPGINYAYPTVEQLQESTRISSPFADFFGVIQQGLPTELPASDQSAATKAAPVDVDLTSSEDLQEDDLSDALVDSLQTRFVTTAGAELVTSCMEYCAGHPSHMAFLKQLHQLLMQTCDADWAFRDRSSTWTTKPDAKHLLTASTLVPSASAVMLLSRENNHKADLVPLMPAHLSRIHRRSGSAVLGERSKVQTTCPVPSPLHLVNGVVSGLSDDIAATDAPKKTSLPVRLDCTVENDFFASPTNSNQADQSRHGPISALCTPLPYDLLLTPPIPKAKRKSVLSSQNNRCAGCGTFIETRYLKRMRFCEFFARYFCCVCHANTLMVLPGNLLTNWDFRMMPVCNIARDRLHQLHRQPLLRWPDFSRRVVQTQPCLRNCHTLRTQGRLLLPFVQFCQNAQELLMALAQLPSHWLQSPDIWSMADLCAVRDGQFESRLRMALQPMVDHLSACPRCRAQGYVCEVCHSGQILFPFGQVNTVMCPACSACFHRNCLRQPRPETCPRCIRRNERRKRSQSHPAVPPITVQDGGDEDDALMLALR